MPAINTNAVMVTSAIYVLGNLISHSRRVRKWKDGNS